MRWCMSGEPFDTELRVKLAARDVGKVDGQRVVELLSRAIVLANEHRDKLVMPVESV